MKKFYITPKTNTPALKISKLVITLTLLLVSSFFQITRANTWDGNVSSAWENPSNWSSGIVPDATTDATIPTTPLGARFPIITFGAQGVNILIIQSGAVLTMTGGTLEVAQDWANNGSFDATGGTVMFTGGATVISDFSSGANNFYNLTVENAVDPLFNQYLGSMIYIAGDFVNNNASLPAQDIRSTFIFNGSIDQYFYSVSSDIICGTFTVNKTGGKVFLNSHLYTTDFTMTSGDLATSNFNLTIAGNWLNNGGNFLGGTSMVTLTGSGKVIDGSNSTFFPSITLQDGLREVYRWYLSSIAIHSPELNS